MRLFGSLKKKDTGPAQENAAGAGHLFSVVIPVHDVAEHLRYAIRSIVNQDIGLDKIQIILVNDGSTDDSEAVCQKFADRYPKNVVYVRQDRKGLAAARNAGLSLATGTYLSFLDGDCKWSSDAFQRALDFFSAHPDVHAVALRPWYFGAKEGPLALDFEYAGDCVVDIGQRPDFIQLSMCNMIVERRLLEGRAFDEDPICDYDTQFATDLLLDAGRYGICSKGRYRCRAQGIGRLASGMPASADERIAQLECLMCLMERSVAQFGNAAPYLQHVAAYSTLPQLVSPPHQLISENTLEAYRRIVVNLLERIDDGIIGRQAGTSLAQRAYALALKHGADPDDALKHLSLCDDTLYLNWDYADGSADSPLGEFPGSLNHVLDVSFVIRTASGFRIEGHSNFLNWSAADRVAIEFVSQTDPSRVMTSQLMPRHDRQVKTLFHGHAFSMIGFCADVPWDGVSDGGFWARIVFDGVPITASLRFSKHTGLTPARQNGANYWALDDAILRFRWVNKVDTLLASPNTRELRAECERALREDARKKLEENEAQRVLGLRDYALQARNDVSRPHVWLICDRPAQADDNGEALFRYLNKNPVAGVKPVFAIMGNAPDYQRMQQYGTVVAMDSPEYDRYLLTCDFFITSSGDDPRRHDYAYYKDLYHFKFVFLQHGVTKDDVSRWLNRYNKDIKVFVTAAPRERESIIRGRYGYTESQVALVGFPRHDRLIELGEQREVRKRILVMPTWREHLIGGIDPETGIHLPNPLFDSSEFAQRWRELLYSPRMDQLLERHGFELHFVLHPGFRADIGCFHDTERVKVFATCNYQEAFADAAVMVTDYSSVAFDFAILKKPIVYYQFDQDTFFQNHSLEKGYFSYEDDGFGPVVKTADEVIDRLEERLAHDCQIDSLYRERIEDFFFYPDQPRCKLLVDRLLAL